MRKRSASNSIFQELGDMICLEPVCNHTPLSRAIPSRRIKRGKSQFNIVAAIRILCCRNRASAGCRDSTWERSMVADRVKADHVTQLLKY